MIDGLLFSSSVEMQQLSFRCIKHDFTDWNGLLNSLIPVKRESVYFVFCPKQGLKKRVLPTQGRVFRVFLS